MRIKTSLIIIFALLIVIFTLQNTEAVIVKLWFWEVKTSRALIIIGSIAIGAFFGMLLPPLLKKCDEDSEKDDDKDNSHEITDDKEKK